jgi:hypothetical protein
VREFCTRSKCYSLQSTYFRGKSVRSLFEASNLLELREYYVEACSLEVSKLPRDQHNNSNSHDRNSDLFPHHNQGKNVCVQPLQAPQSLHDATNIACITRKLLATVENSQYPLIYLSYHSGAVEPQQST